MKDFYSYFSEKMAALHVPAPSSLFATGKQAKQTISDIVGAIRAFGTKATLREIILIIPSLSVAGDLLMLGSAVQASFYAGGCIGSLAVATDRRMSGGRQIADFFGIGRGRTSDPYLLRRFHREYVRAQNRMR
jgi:hypothetical protein